MTVVASLVDTIEGVGVTVVTSLVDIIEGVGVTVVPSLIAASKKVKKINRFTTSTTVYHAEL